MMEMLTGVPWLMVLRNIKQRSDDSTARALAGLLYDILDASSDPVIGNILDAHARQVLGTT